VLIAPGAARWSLVLARKASLRGLLLLRFARHRRFGLCFLFGPKLLVSGFSAVGDLGQKFADVFDFGVSPHVNDTASHGDDFRRGDLSYRDVVGQSVIVNAQFFCRFAGGVLNHSSILSEIQIELVNKINGKIVRNEESKASG
jgi:hypothetical protein